MAVSKDRTPLGRVVATERRPNTTHEFHFWTPPEAPVGIGTVVVVEDHDGRVNAPKVRIFGVVVEGMSYTNLQSPFDDVYSREGEPGGRLTSAESRSEIRLYTAAVLRQIPDEPRQPVPMGAVFLPTDVEVATALRMDAYLTGDRRTGIPIGLYRAGGIESPVFLDADFLVGPEAAHLNIAGVSGLATKTSAVEWFLNSAFAHFPSEKGSIAALCFNVKGPDLCFLDQAGEISDADRAIYERLHVPPAPFPKVRYFAPYNAQGSALNTLRAHPDLLHNVSPLTWGLSEVLQHAEVLLNRDDIDAKADALIAFISERVVDRDFSDQLLGVKRYRVRSFADLEEWFRDVVQALEAVGRDSWRTHHIATIRKLRNRLSNISTRCAGLVTDDGSVSDLPFGSFEDRTVYVLDVANLEEDAQDLIFARVVSKLREQLEHRALGVDHLVVFVDELNKYAAADAPDTYVRQMLLDIAERGRYLGLVLVGAQQFRSQVHRRVTGNSATSLFGRMDPDELASPAYSTLSPALKTRLSTLEKGQLMVRHPHFAQPVFVRFPRPAVLAGRDGLERFPLPADVALDVSVWRALQALDSSITHEWVVKATALHDDREIIRARNKTVLSRPVDVKQYFTRSLPAVTATRRAGAENYVSATVRMPEGEDPYAT